MDIQQDRRHTEPHESQRCRISVIILFHKL
jgi:hypothetical protein